MRQQQRPFTHAPMHSCTNTHTHGNIPCVTQVCVPPKCREKHNRADNLTRYTHSSGTLHVSCVVSVSTVCPVEFEVGAVDIGNLLRTLAKGSRFISKISLVESCMLVTIKEKSGALQQKPAEQPRALEEASRD